MEGILWEIRGSKPAHGHIFLASHLAMVLEVLGVEDGQAVVDIALEAAGEREKCGTSWPEASPENSLASRGHEGEGIPWKASSISHMRKVQGHTGEG